MAEFSELVQIKKRICIKYKSSGCIGCPLEHSGGDLCGIISISGYSDNRFMELEEVLLSWAAEHPEPVYPTWAEFLHEAFCERYPLPYRGDTAWYAFLRETHIPADIAQKLGIEPKEG